MQKYAHDLQDECLLLAKLSAEDMIALEVKYHPKCFALLYNKEAALDVKDNCDQSDNFNLCITLVEFF